MAVFIASPTGRVVTGSRGNLTRAITAPPTSGGTPLVSLVKYDTRNNVVETVAPKGIANGASVSCSTNLSGAINSSGLFVTDLAYDTALGTELLSITRTYADPDLGLQTATTTFAYPGNQHYSAAWQRRWGQWLHDHTVL